MTERDINKMLKPGQLNPVTFQSRVPIATPDKIIDNRMSIYNESISNLMNPNLFEGISEFKAQVLLTVKGKEEKRGFWKLIKSVMPESLSGRSSLSEYFCICRIPELHQAFPDPNQYADENPKKIKAILRHPAFEFSFSGINPTTQPLPGPGSIVRVKFADNLKRTGEVVGIEASTSEVPLPEFRGTARDAFSLAPLEPSDLGKNQARWYTQTENREIKRIVLHVTAGNAGEKRAQRTIDYFANSGEILRGDRKVSIHYAADQAGNIVQGVLEKDIAYHVGKGNINATSIGIEMTGNNGVANGIGGRAGNWPPGVTGIAAGKGAYGLYAGMFTEQLIEAVAKLCAEICDRNNLTISRKTITGHEEWWPGHKFGPGQALNEKYGRTDYWNWTDFMARVVYYSNQTDPTYEKILQEADRQEQARIVENLYGL